MARSTLLQPMAMWPWVPRPGFFMISNSLLPTKMLELPGATFMFSRAARALAVAEASSSLALLMPTWTSLRPSMVSTASLHMAVILAQSPALITSLLHIQVPPTAKIWS